MALMCPVQTLNGHTQHCQLECITSSMTSCLNPVQHVSKPSPCTASADHVHVLAGGSRDSDRLCLPGGPHSQGSCCHCGRAWAPGPVPGLEEAHSTAAPSLVRWVPKSPCHSILVSRAAGEPCMQRLDVGGYGPRGKATTLEQLSRPSCQPLMWWSACQRPAGMDTQPNQLQQALACMKP